MGELKTLRDKVLENHEARAAYEDEKKVLAEEIEEWERGKRHREQRQEDTTIAVRM